MGTQIHKGLRKPFGFWRRQDVLSILGDFVDGKIGRAEAYKKLEIAHYGEPMAGKTLDWYVRKYLRESRREYVIPPKGIAGQAARLTLSPGDGLVLPGSYREALSLKEGEEVILQIGDGELRIIAPRQALKKAQVLVREHVPEGRSLADELIAERGQEATGE